MSALRLSRLFCPPRLKLARRVFGARSIRILDLGCGNNSPTITKQWLPAAEYHGADIRTPVDARDAAATDRFYLVTADGGGYDQIPDAAYDFVILNHVLEHIRDQQGVLAAVCAKLKVGGLIWIAFPSLRSLELPSAEGTLNFCDDDTHVRLCDVREVANGLLANGVKVLKGGRSREPLLFAIGLVVLPFALLSRLVTGKMSARGLWYVTGFEDRVIGRRTAPLEAFA